SETGRRYRHPHRFPPASFRCIQAQAPSSPAKPCRRSIPNPRNRRRSRQSMGVANKGSIPPLDRRSEEPFYRQIYGRFRSAIAAGSLKPGDRIPSARALTKELGLARGTIEAAYSLLAAEG